MGILTQCCVKGESKITKVDAENPAFVLSQVEPYINDRIARWSEALRDARCVKVLLALHATYSPRFALSARAIGRLAGLHHQVVRRLIRGDRHCRAKLVGLVAWLEGKGRRGTRFWLTPEGRKVAELVADDFQVGKATLTALATDRWRRKMAHYAEMAHQNGTPSENNMPLNGFNNVCRLTPVRTSKPSNGNPIGQKPVNDLAKRLHRDYGVTLWVANDIVTRYSPAEIEAAIALRERRNGAIYNGAGFIVYLLSHGFARNYVRARLQARQRAQPPPNEPDFDKAVQALRDALSPYGITVDDEGFAELPNGRLALPLDPNEAIDLLRRHGILRNGNGQSADALFNFFTIWASEAPMDGAADQHALFKDLTMGAADQQTDPTDNDDADLPECNNAFAEAEPTDSNDSDDEGKPLLPLKCELCGRKEGEPHPALQSWQRNDFLCLSELSDAFKQRFGLPECGLLCRGCYVTLGLRLVGTSDPDGNGQATDQPTTDEGFRAADDLHDDLHDALVDANPYQPELKAMAWAADQDLPDDDDAIADATEMSWASDGQNDLSDDGENCLSLAKPTANAGFVADKLTALPADSDEGQNDLTQGKTHQVGEGTKEVVK